MAEFEKDAPLSREEVPADDRYDEEYKDDGYDRAPGSRPRAASPARKGRAGRAARLRRGRRRWRTFLAVYALVFLALGAAGCYLLYRYAEAYEASLPEHVMDALMAETTEDQWYNYIRRDAPLAVSEFEDGEALFTAYYAAAIRGRSFSYRKAPGAYRDDGPVYTVRAGGKDLCTVTLAPIGRHAAGFGRELWQVGEIRSCFTMDDLESVAVVIDAPPGDSVSVNGVTLSDAYRTGETVPAPDVTELESRFETQPMFDRWRVDPLYGEITVRDKNGAVLSPLREEGSREIRYLAREEELYSFTVRAPEGVTVTVGGAELSPAEAVKAEDGILAGLEAYTGGETLRQLTWSYGGLYSLPEITGRAADGTALTPLMNEKGELLFFLPQDEALREAAEPRVREFFQRYIDYSSRAYDEGRYNMLLSCILPGTELYAYVRDSVAAMIWASATQVHYDELTFTDFRSVGEDCFTCTIRYKADFSATAWYESYTYDLQNAYELAFVRQGDLWYAAAMSAIAG